MARYDNLFQPIQVGPIAIPNRIVRTAHGTFLSGEPLIAYHEARARGGVGMSTLEASSVHAAAPSGLPVHADLIVPFYQELGSRVHRHGMKLFQQLFHPGASTIADSALAPVWSVSEVPNPLVNIMPCLLYTSDAADE